MMGYSWPALGDQPTSEVTGMTTSPQSSMETHPGILDIRTRHEMAERTATTSQAQTIETMALLTGLYLAASPWISARAWPLAASVPSRIWRWPGRTVAARVRRRQVCGPW